MDTFEFAGLKVKDMPFGGAYRMSGFGNGFDGYLGLGRSVDFNNTKIGSTASGNYRRLYHHYSSASLTTKRKHFRFEQA